MRVWGPAGWVPHCNTERWVEVTPELFSPSRAFEPDISNLNTVLCSSYMFSW